MRSAWPIVPSLKITAPIAPASPASSAFRPKSHVPRCSRTTLPTTSGPKSAASQPESEALAWSVGGVKSTATAAAVASPVPEKSAVYQTPASPS